MARPIVEGDIELVKALTKKVLGTDELESFERMGGLTNHTYKISVNGGELYVARVPGEGTEEMINRNDEKVSTELACNLNIDAELLYFGDDGTKLTKYVKGAKTLSPEIMQEEHSYTEAAKIFAKLHNCGVDTKVPFEVFDMADSYEKVIYSNNVPMYDDYEDVKAQVMKIKNYVDSTNDIKLVPCHNDSLCENWIFDEDGRLYLIDWEYAGMNDGWWDVADVSIEAHLNEEQDMKFVTAYLGHEPNKNDMNRFIANKLYLDYLWTLWGKTRVPFDGQEMEDYATERYIRLKENLNKFNMEG